MIRAYKYKLKPTMKQQKALCQAFGNARFIFNWGLNRKKESWEKEKKNVTYLELAKELTVLKQDGEHDWLKNCANVVRDVEPGSLIKKDAAVSVLVASTPVTTT